MIKFTKIKDYSKTSIVNILNKALNESSNIIHEPLDVGKEYKTLINTRPFKANGLPDSAHGKEGIVYCWSSDLISWKGFIPILGNQLEDPFLLPKKNGKYVIACEDKPIGGDARNIKIFANSKIENFKKSDLVRTLKPKYDFDNHSRMSPTMCYRGDEILVYWEARFLNYTGNDPDLIWNDLRQFTVGLTIISSINYTVIKDYNKPIVKEFTIFDDITDKLSDGYYYAVTHDWKKLRPLVSRWRGQIWRSKHRTYGWAKWTDLITTDGLYPMPQMLVVGNKVSLFYSLWKHFRGRRLAFPVYNEEPIKPPPNGGEMNKPVIELVGNTLKVINPIAGAEYSWQYWNKLSPNKFTSWLSPFGDTYEIPSGKQKDGYEFWCYQKEGTNTSPDSDRLVYGSSTAPVVRGCTNSNAINYNPAATEDDGSCEFAPSGDFDKAKVLASVNRVRAEMDIIEAEVKKA